MKSNGASASSGFRRNSRKPRIDFARNFCLGLLLAIPILTCATTTARATLVLSSDNKTVYDTSTGVTWLADFNMPATHPYGLGCSQHPELAPNCINSDGSMNYVTAVEWVTKLNDANFAGSSNWKLPTTWAGTSPPGAGPPGPGCTGTGSEGNPFGFGCTNSDLARLYSNSLDLTAPNSAVPVAQNSVCVAGSSTVCFSNFQPNFYWSSDAVQGSNEGYQVFSFATGTHDGIVGKNGTNKQNGNIIVVGTFVDVLPVFQLQSAPKGAGSPILIDHNQAIYDPATGAIWPRDANPAYTFYNMYTKEQLQKMLGLTQCDGVGTTSSAPDCINDDGSMNWSSADRFVKNLNKIDYLGLNALHPQGQWVLPDTNQLQDLFYKTLGLAAGSPVAPTPQPTAPGNPFRNIQMTYYWSCLGRIHGRLAIDCNYAASVPNSPGFEWDYSLSNGYEGTDHSGQPANKPL